MYFIKNVFENYCAWSFFLISPRIRTFKNISSTNFSFNFNLLTFFQLQKLKNIYKLPEKINFYLSKQSDDIADKCITTLVFHKLTNKMSIEKEHWEIVKELRRRFFPSKLKFKETPQN